MDKQKFIECLRNPSMMKDAEIEELDQLIRKYPYFQRARALTAKVSKNRSRPDLKRKLASAAVYATDRTLLKKFLDDHLFIIESKQEAQQKKEARSQSAVSERKAGVTGAEAHPKQSESAVEFTETKDPVSKPVQKSAEEQLPPATPPEEDDSLDQLIEEIYSDMEDLKKSKSRFREVEKRIEEDEAINAAISKASAAGMRNNPKEEKPKIGSASEDTEEGKTAPDDTKSDSGSQFIDIKTLREKLEQEDIREQESSRVPRHQGAAEPKTGGEQRATAGNPTPDIPIPKKDSDEARHFEWAGESLREKNPEIHEERERTAKSPVLRKELEETTEKKPDTLKVVRRRSGKVQSTTFETIKRVSEEDKLISEFISKSPGISQGKQSRGSAAGEAEDLAQDSTRFQADIATEYLAEIYVEQGKIDRAISIYEKLGLKFPEKKSFFAARIKKLESKVD